MPDAAKTAYTPHRVSPPGDTLAETLEELSMSQAELARRMGRPTKTINEIVQRKTAILPETAFQLENVLGIPASFWLARETAYRTSLARTSVEPPQARPSVDRGLTGCLESKKKEG